MDNSHTYLNIDARISDFIQRKTATQGTALRSRPIAKIPPPTDLRYELVDMPVTTEK